MGAARWIAIGLGMVGVAVVLRPSGSGVSLWPGLAMLFAATAYALSALTVRILGRTDSTQAMVFWMVTLLSLGATALALPDWQPIRAQDWPVLAAIAVTASPPISPPYQYFGRPSGAVELPTSVILCG